MWWTGRGWAYNMRPTKPATTAARHDIHDWPHEHPDSLLPGSPVAPSCP